MNPAIVLGGSPTGLAVLRALGRHGVDCHVGDFSSGRPAFYSRYLSGKPIIAHDANAVVAMLKKQAEKTAILPVVIPTSDAMVLAISELASQGPLPFITYDAIASGLAAQLVDKQSFYQLCKKAGIETPQTSFPQSIQDLRSIAQEFQFPLLLKPIYGHLWRERLRGRKLLVAENRMDLDGFIKTIGDEVTGLMVQELIPGSEANIFVAAIYRGRLGSRDACFVAEKTRQYPPDFGSASLATAKCNDEIAERSWQFVEEVDYRGICGTEFKRDPRDGRYKMIEVNPRPTLWFHLAQVSGVELLHAAYLDLTGQPLPEIGEQHEGTRWCFPEKDILTWMHHLRHRDVSPWSLLSTFSPWNHGAVGALCDPGPMFASPWYYSKRLLKRALSLQKNAKEGRD